MKKDKNVIVITRASSGFGALGARAVARTGHTVHASMRETAGRNAPRPAGKVVVPLDERRVSDPR